VAERRRRTDDVDITGSYDAFTFTTMLQLEDYGFCKKGEGGQYVSDGTITLGGRPSNTSGGHLCEGYTHGMNMVIENTRQRAATSTIPARSGRRQAQAHLRLSRGRRRRQGCRSQRQSRLGQPGDGVIDGHAARLRKGNGDGTRRSISRHGAARR
jgi:acetyl-CoA acetyltransferase